MFEDREKSPHYFPIRFFPFNSVQIILSAFLIYSSLNGTAHGGKPDLYEKLSSFPFCIAFTGEENGYLEPCGCAEKQLGGLSKRYSLIELLKRKNKNCFFLSLGDLPGKVGRQDEIKVEITLMAFGMMGYTIHNIGEKDIDMGIELLNYLSQTNNIDLLSSNVITRGEQNLNIKPYIMKIIETEGKVYKVCVLGILSPELIDEETEIAEILNPAIALKSLLKELSGEADMFVLLSHAEIKESIKLAEAFPELDLVISGHTIDFPENYITKVNDTFVIPAGEKGKYLGVFGFLPADPSSDKNRLLGFSRLKREYYGLTPYYREETLQKVLPVEIIALDETYEDSPEIDRLLKIYQQRLKDEELAKNVYREPHPSGSEFTGNEPCSLCHNKIFKQWQETGHAQAYKTLLISGHQNDPECLFCHTIGMLYISGFETIESTPGMKDVGCECCHGPGSRHKESPQDNYGEVPPENCEICHETEHSPHFNFKEYWQKIKHPPKEE